MYVHIAASWSGWRESKYCRSCLHATIHGNDCIYLGHNASEGCFLLLDINQPKRRLQAIISQSKPECILSCNLAGSIQAVPTGEQTPHVFQTAIAYLGFTSRVHGKTQRGCNNRSLTGKLHPLFPRYFRITTWWSNHFVFKLFFWYVYFWNCGFPLPRLNHYHVGSRGKRQPSPEC